MSKRTRVLSLMATFARSAANGGVDIQAVGKQRISDLPDEDELASFVGTETIARPGFTLVSTSVQELPLEWLRYAVERIDGAAP